jgi:3-methyladenine DNA glycosylase AlkC
VLLLSGWLSLMLLPRLLAEVMTTLHVRSQQNLTVLLLASSVLRLSATAVTPAVTAFTPSR